MEQLDTLTHKTSSALYTCHLLCQTDLHIYSFLHVPLSIAEIQCKQHIKQYKFFIRATESFSQLIESTYYIVDQKCIKIIYHGTNQASA